MSEAGNERFEGEVVHQRHPLEDQIVRLRVDARSLFFEDVEVDVRRGFLCGAFEQTPEGKYRVLLAAELKPGKIYAPWSFIVPDRETAQTMLRAAGVEVGQRALKLRFASRLSVPVMVVGILLAVFLLIPEFSRRGDNAVLFKMFLILSSTAIFCAILVWVGHSLVTVGTDGLLFRRYGRARFVAFSAIQSVALTHVALSLELVGRRHLFLTQFISMGPRTQLREEDCYAEIIAMRIRDAIAMREKTNATATDERRDMPIADWIRELRDNPIKPPSYRVSPTRDHDHDLILEDTTADVVTRACAAVALRVREGETVVPRLRVAAAATASPKLRVALEKIAAGAPDSEIARSIEKLR